MSMFKSPETVNMLLDTAKGTLQTWLELDIERKILSYTGLARCSHKDPHQRKVGGSEPEKDVMIEAEPGAKPEGP